MSLVKRVPEKVEKIVSENIVTPTQSPKPSTSGIHTCPIYGLPVIYRSGSETDTEQISQLAL